MSNVKLDTLIPVERMVGDDPEDTALLMKALSEATAYLGNFKWCRSIRERHFGFGIGGVVAVFLFRIEPVGSHDEYLWVVVGDLPSAYLVTDQAPTARAALNIYCDLMQGWVTAVRAGTSLDQVFPVGVEPTEENASLLHQRVSFLRKEIIPTL